MNEEKSDISILIIAFIKSLQICLQSKINIIYIIIYIYSSSISLKVYSSKLGKKACNSKWVFSFEVRRRLFSIQDCFMFRTMNFQDHSKAWSDLMIFRPKITDYSRI